MDDRRHNMRHSHIFLLQLVLPSLTQACERINFTFHKFCVNAGESSLFIRCCLVRGSSRIHPTIQVQPWVILDMPDGLLRSLEWNQTIQTKFTTFLTCYLSSQTLSLASWRQLFSRESACINAFSSHNRSTKGLHIIRWRTNHGCTRWHLIRFALFDLSNPFSRCAVWALWLQHHLPHFAFFSLTTYNYRIIDEETNHEVGIVLGIEWYLHDVLYFPPSAHSSSSDRNSLIIGESPRSEEFLLFFTLRQSAHMASLGSPEASQELSEGISATQLDILRHVYLETSL